MEEPTIHWKKTVLITAWVFFAVAGIVNMAVGKRFWEYESVVRVEAIFALRLRAFSIFV
jgi:hypothetical protein